MSDFDKIERLLRKGERDARLLDGRDFKERPWKEAYRLLDLLREKSAPAQVEPGCGDDLRRELAAAISAWRAGLVAFDPGFDDPPVPLSAVVVRSTVEQFLTGQGWEKREHGERERWRRKGSSAWCSLPLALGDALHRAETLDVALRNEGGEG